MATTARTGSRSGDGSTRRPGNDPLLVMLTSAVTMELLASLGIAFGTPGAQAGMLGMLTVSVPMVAGSALLLRRHPSRPAARRIYLGLLVGAVLNAVVVGAVLGPVCGLVVLVAFFAVYGRHSGELGRNT